MEKIEIQIVYHTDNYGKKEIVAITNDAAKWIKHSNSFKDKTDYENLESFEICPTNFIKF